MNEKTHKLQDMNTVTSYDLPFSFHALMLLAIYYNIFCLDPLFATFKWMA